MADQPANAAQRTSFFFEGWQFDVVTVGFDASPGAHWCPPHPRLKRRLAQTGLLQALTRRLAAARALGVDRAVQRAGPMPSTMKALIVLVDFSDKFAGQIPGYDSSLTHYRDLLDSLGIYPTGSMRDYYLEQSYGTFELRTDVPNGAGGALSGWYRAPETYAYYAAGNYGFGGYPTNAQGLARAAAELADAEVDYRQYDGDSNGSVDAFAVIHAGIGAEETGNPDDIWSHQWFIPSGGYLSAEGVRVVDYSMEPENCQVGVVCHEFGHIFGLPDLYDTDEGTEQSPGIGHWSLMANNWLGDPSGSRPPHLDVWCKIQLGWVTPIVPTENVSGASLPPIETNPVAYKLYTNGQPQNEYWLVTNRRKIGFDEYLPGEGLLIWHIDESVASNRNENHRKVDLEQADGNFDLNQTPYWEGNEGDDGDPWPGSTDNRNFTNTSTPNSLIYAGYDSFVRVTAISDPGAIMTADLSVESYPPQVQSASYVDGTHVNVVFDQRMDERTAESIGNYTVTPSLEVTEAVLNANDMTVHLTTAKQADATVYTVIVTQVKSYLGVTVDPAHNTAEWTSGQVAPWLVEAAPVDDRHVDLIFDEAMDETSAESAVNYALAPPLTVTGAALDADRATVHLSTADQAENTTYTVTVSNIKDTAGNVIDASHNTAEWTTPQIPPQVVSATYVDDRRVDILFNEPVDETRAENVVNYVISPRLTVMSAELDADRLTVHVGTASQVEGTVYSVTVRNVQDVAGVLIDPAYNTAQWTTPGLYEVSGVVTDEAGAALPGAMVSAYDAQGNERSVMANDQGRYSLPNLPPGGHTIVARHAGYGFIPARISVTVAEQDIADVNFVGYLAFSVSLTPGAASPWRMLCFPAGANVEERLDPLPSAVKRYDAQTRSFDTSSRTFSRGQSCFVATESAVIARFPQAEVPDSSQPVRIPLHKSWNMIGNVYAEPLAWLSGSIGVYRSGAYVGSLDEAYRQKLIGRVAWVWDADEGGYTLLADPAVSDSSAVRNVASPLEGFFLLAAEEDLEIEYAGAAPAAALSCSRRTAEGFLLNISARAEDARDPFNFLGVLPDAQDSAIFGAAPPAPPDASSARIDLVFVQAAADRGQAPGAEADVAIHAAQSLESDWPAVVRTVGVRGEVHVICTDLRQLPRDYCLHVLDVQSGRRINLRTAPGYSYWVDSPEPSTRQLVFQVRRREAGVLAIFPQSVRALGRGASAAYEIVYALTRDANIVVTIRNVAGRVIRRLWQGDQAAGRNAVVWDGRSDSGTLAPAGQYVVEIAGADPEDGTRVRAVCTLVR